MDKCDECGYVYEALPGNEIAPTIAGISSQFPEAFLAAMPTDRATIRSTPLVWSPLEYICHVRDVLFVQRDRLFHALVIDKPQFPPMHRDERVVLGDYAHDDVDRVLEELSIGAGLISRLFAGLSGVQLARLCIYNYPGPVERDLTWLGRHTIHELKHHLLDVQAGLGSSVRDGA